MRKVSGLTPEAIRQGEKLFDFLRATYGGPGAESPDYLDQRRQFVTRLAAFVQALPADQH